MARNGPAANAVEALKAARDGLDVEVLRYAHQGWVAIPKDDVERLKWWGIFLRRQSEGEPGYFMIRIRIPNGIATAAQVREIATISAERGRGIADITTRQQIQIRWIRIEDVPEILERLRRAGLTTLQTGMDNVRNVVGCPLAGLLPTELLDASPVVRAFTARIVGNRAYTNLPRKFNVTITGCRENCTHAQTQDLALVPAVREGLVGFNVLVGGKMGSGGYRIASSLDAFVTPDQAPEVCAAIVEIFRDFGLREARSKARLSFLLDLWGVERFREVLEDRLGYPLSPAGRDERKPTATDHIGVIPQKHQGLYAVGLLVPVGRVRSNSSGAAGARKLYRHRLGGDPHGPRRDCRSGSRAREGGACWRAGGDATRRRSVLWKSAARGLRRALPVQLQERVSQPRQQLVRGVRRGWDERPEAHRHPARPRHQLP